MNSLIRRLATHLLVNPIHGGVDGRPRAKHKKDKRPFLQAGRVFTGHRTAVNRRGGVSGVVTSDSDNDNVHSVTHARCALGANTPRRVDSLFQHQSDKPGDNENRRRNTQRPSNEAVVAINGYTTHHNVVDARFSPCRHTRAHPTSEDVRKNLCLSPSADGRHRSRYRPKVVSQCRAPPPPSRLHRSP